MQFGILSKLALCHQFFTFFHHQSFCHCKVVCSDILNFHCHLFVAELYKASIFLLLFHMIYISMIETLVQAACIDLWRLIQVHCTLFSFLLRYAVSEWFCIIRKLYFNVALRILQLHVFSSKNQWDSFGLLSPRWISGCGRHGPFG